MLLKGYIYSGSSGSKYFDKKLWDFRENCVEFYKYRNVEYG